MAEGPPGGNRLAARRGGEQVFAALNQMGVSQSDATRIGNIAATAANDILPANERPH